MTPDDVDVDPRFQEMHRGGLAEDVGRDGPLILLGRNMVCMTPDQLVEAETRQRPTSAVQENGAGTRSRRRVSVNVRRDLRSRVCLTQRALSLKQRASDTPSCLS